MKHIFDFKWLMLATILPMSVACDDVSEEDRIIDEGSRTTIVGQETKNVTCDGENFSFTQEKRLLLEDFTGWKCVNCPAIAEFLTHKITPVYPSVLVSLHMTTNSFSAKHHDGYNCTSADSICDFINGSPIASQISLPSVFINNESLGGQRYTSDTIEISNKALSLYTESLKSGVKTDVAVNTNKLDGNKYSISTYIYEAERPSQCLLQLWLIEDGLISTLQQSSAGWIRNYENHGILREVINGACTGQQITLNSEGQAVVRNTLDLTGKSYISANCRVVAVVLNAEDNTVDNCIAVPLE